MLCHLEPVILLGSEADKPFPRNLIFSIYNNFIWNDKRNTRMEMQKECQHG